MKKLILIFGIILTTSYAYSQIKIGMDANNINNYIKYSVKEYNRVNYSRNMYSNPYATSAAYDVKYSNGQISEVIACHRNTDLFDFGIRNVDLCKHYLMNDDTLYSIVVVYENISLEKVTEAHDKLDRFYKVGDYYFSDDFNNYTILGLNEMNHPTASLHKTNLNSLPLNIKADVVKKYNETKIEKERQEKEKEAQRIKAEKLQSKSYDIAGYDTILYRELYEKQIDEIVETVQNQLTIDYLVSKDMTVGFYQNIYSIHYRLFDETKEKNENALNEMQEGYRSYIPGQISEISLVKGSDTECWIVKRSKIELPKIEIDGVDVRTEMFIDSLVVVYGRGITEVKVKEEEVVFRKNKSNITSINELILSELKMVKQGKYIVYYEFGNIGNKKIRNITFELK